MAKFYIVEDEVLIAEEIKVALRNLGHTVIGHTIKGERVIEALENLNADMVLLDINIKGTLTGIGLAAQIREKLDLPFIFLTALSDQDTLNKAKKTMPYGYIVKPFSEASLKAVIEMALFKYHQERSEAVFSKEAIESTYGIPLSEREFQVLEAFKKGESYKSTAAATNLSVNTVKTYQKKLYQYFGVNSKVELIQKLNANNK